MKLRTASMIFTGLLAITGLTFVAGCEEEGPMENAGEALDDAARDTGEAMEEAGEEMEDAVTPN